MALRTNRYSGSRSIRRARPCSLSRRCAPMSHGTEEPWKPASRERTRIVLPFHVSPGLGLAPPSSWIRSRNLRPTSPDVGEHRDAPAVRWTTLRCPGSIAFSSERQSLLCPAGQDRRVAGLFEPLIIYCPFDTSAIISLSNAPSRAPTM